MTHKEYLDKMWRKNKHYRKEEFKVLKLLPKNNIRI